MFLKAFSTYPNMLSIDISKVTKLEMGSALIRGQAKFLWGGSNLVTRIMVGQNFRNGGVKTYKGMVNCSVLGSITEIRAEGVKIFTFIIKKI